MNALTFSVGRVTPALLRVGLLTGGILAGQLLAGCAAGSEDLAPSDGNEQTSTPAPEADGDDYATPEPTLPPEQEDAFYRTAPAASDRYVFVVNPDRDTLSKINATTRAVYTLPVGLHPTQVSVGSLNPNRAVVLNEADASLSIVDVTTDAVSTIGIHPDTNYLALSPDGQYAITWFDARVEDADLSVDGVRSYSSISVVFTGTESQAATSTPMAVGLNPRGGVFIPQTQQALVQCDDAVVQISLSATPTFRMLPLTDDIDEDLQVAEMKVSPDGKYAFLRLANVPELVVLDLLATDPLTAASRISLNAVVTDMELSGESLILVDRENRALEVYDTSDPGAAPALVPTPLNQLVGAVVVSAEQGRAILYTTLTEKDIQNTDEEDIPLNRFSVWDIASNRISLYELVKPVASVSLNKSTTADVATFIHQGDADSDLSAFDGKDAFSHFYFSDGLVVPSVLESPIKAMASAPAGNYEYMILEDNLNVVVVNYSTRQVSAARVQSPPAFVGILTGSNTGYISQEHDLGRLSFIEPETLEVSTITGFELNSQ